MVTYALSDIHGCWDAFERSLALVDLSRPDVRLVLLGDYIDHDHARPAIYGRLRALQEAHPGQVTLICGNHDADYVEECRAGEHAADGTGETLDDDMLRWILRMPLYLETDAQIFVHAGVDEEAGDLWKWASEDWYFTSKYPPTYGRFEKDVVAGHVGTRGLCGEDRVCWDGESHYYLDGTTEESGVVPVLKYDDETGRYTTFDQDGHGGWGPETAVRRMGD